MMRITHGSEKLKIRFLCSATIFLFDEKLCNKRSYDVHIETTINTVCWCTGCRKRQYWMSHRKIEDNKGGNAPFFLSVRASPITWLPRRDKIHQAKGHLTNHGLGVELTTCYRKQTDTGTDISIARRNPLGLPHRSQSVRIILWTCELVEDKRNRLKYSSGELTSATGHFSTRTWALRHMQCGKYLEKNFKSEIY